MSLEIKRGVARDATRELTLAFQLSNFCRELGKAKIIPGTTRILGAHRKEAPDSVAEDTSGYKPDKKTSEA